jgi:hypothetical protein
MPCLEGVVFDVRLSNREQVASFNGLLKKTTKWTSPCSAIFEHANISNFTAIVNHFSPGTLKAVQLPIGSRRSCYKVLKRSCRSLEALHVYTPNFSPVLQLSRCMDDPVIQWICDDFPCIDSLVLDQSILYSSYRDRILGSLAIRIFVNSI